MIICGLTGGIGHGKTTFAGLLAAQSRSSSHFETWQLVAEVATALRAENTSHPAADDIEAINNWLLPLSDVIAQHIHSAINYDQLKLTAERLGQHSEYYDKLFEYLRAVQASQYLTSAEITDDTKQAFRPLLQWLGGFLVAIGGDVWYTEIIRRIAHLRGSNAELVTVGGVRYPGDAEQLRNVGAVIINIRRPNVPSQDSQDLTERQRNLIQPDSDVLNDGGLQDLAACATQVYHDLSLRQLRPNYSAAPSSQKK